VKVTVIGVYRPRASPHRFLSASIIASRRALSANGVAVGDTTALDERREMRGARATV